MEMLQKNFRKISSFKFATMKQQSDYKNVLNLTKGIKKQMNN